ncbi:unnamed protein product [Prorocentrum cordatum]|uniref:Uncharacterized protein n=1 Tax=Prorocentrum cordatum TaxID=2364126 RepID=A0ABN9W906_9DINO|nr:unnamed protein product [Polarella glacialis]
MAADVHSAIAEEADGTCVVTNRLKVAELMRYHTSNTGDDTDSLKEHVARMQEGQDDIYYITGKSTADMPASPGLDLLRKRGLEVLYITDSSYEYFVQQLEKFNGERLVAVEQNGLELVSEDAGTLLGHGGRVASWADAEFGSGDERHDAADDVEAQSVQNQHRGASADELMEGMRVAVVEELSRKGRGKRVRVPVGLVGSVVHVDSPAENAIIQWDDPTRLRGIGALGHAACAMEEAEGIERTEPWQLVCSVVPRRGPRSALLDSLRLSCWASGRGVAGVGFRPWGDG